MPQATKQPASDSLVTEIAVFEPLCAVFRRTLKQEGLKYTPERARLLEAVIAMEGPFEAEKVMGQVRGVTGGSGGGGGGGGLRISKATVYRTLQLLLQAGIIQRVLVTPQRSYYQLMYGRESTTLIIRTDSGELIVEAVPELRAICEKLCAKHGLTLAGHRLHVFAAE
jgi:Fur family transcriptional regulator, ferric uptake regulator